MRLSLNGFLSRNSLRKLKRWTLPDISRSEWLLFGLPLFIGVSILVSIGPVIQPYIFSLSDTRAPSIYEAAHQSGIAQYPGFLEWLRYAVYPIFVAQSLLICLVSLRKRQFASFALAAGVAAFIALTITDVALGVMQRETNVSYYLTNIISNLIGGLFLAAFVGLALFIRQRLTAASSNRYVWAIPFLLTFASLSVSAFCYVLLTWVYQPTSVHFEATFAAPAEGYLVPRSEGERHDDTTSAAPPTPRRFTFVPERTQVNSFEITSPRGAPAAEFTGASNRSTYTLELGLFANCFRGIEDKPRLVLSDPARIEAVRTAEISFDSGFSEIFLLRQSTLSLRQEEPTFFWLRRSGPIGHQTLQIESFLDARDRVSLEDANSFMFLISAPLMGAARQRASLQPRIIRLNTNRGQFAIALRPGSLSNATRTRDCVPVAQDQLQTIIAGRTSRAAIQMPMNVITAGLLVRISRQPTQDVNVDFQRASLRFGGASGWLTVNGPELDGNTTSYLGETRMISFQGNITHMEVDGASIQVPTGETVTAGGSITGRITRDGQVALSGHSDTLWKEDTRLNPTRWERMATELQVLMLTFLGVASVALVRWYRPIWAKIASNEALITL